MKREAWSGLGLALALAACGHTPEPRIEYREVKVPIAKPCTTTIPVRPAYADDSIASSPDIFSDVKMLKAGRAQRDGYISALEGLAKACFVSP